MDVTLPDGVVIQGVPDGTTKEQLLSKLVKVGHPSAQALLTATSAENTAKETGGVGRFMAGAGKAFADIGQGAKTAAADVMDYFSPRSKTLAGQVAPGDRGDVLRKETDDERALTGPLMNTGAGFAGNLAGNVAALAPTAFIPGANTYTGAALAGALAGGGAPVGTGDSRGMNAAVGAGAGVAGQAAGRAIGRALRPVSPSASPEAQALATAAEREGIPLTAGQATGSRPLQIAESVMENLPLTSESQLAGRATQQRAFTEATLKRAGIAGDAATPQVLSAQKSALGTEIGNIAKGNTLDFNSSTGQNLTGTLGQIVSDASKRGKTAAEPISELVDNILKEVNQVGVMSGENYQAWRQLLRPLADAGGPDAHYYAQVRKALDGAFNDQILTTGGADAWKGANRQYANLKTIMQAAGGPGAPAAVNQIAPTQLATALRNSMGKEGVALGRGDLNELTRIGTTFVRDQIPNSGTAQRQLAQSLLTAGGGSAVGAGAAGATGQDPIKGAAYGAGAGAAALAIPKLVQTLMNSPAGQAYLKKGAVALTESQRDALSNALRMGALGGSQMRLAQ